MNLYLCPADRPRYDDACPCYELNLLVHNPGLPHGPAWDRMDNAAQDQVIATARVEQERRAAAISNTARLPGHRR